MNAKKGMMRTMQEKMSKDTPQILPDPAVDFTRLARSIKAWGNELGFQDISIADAGAEMAQAESGLLEWLSKGYHGEMDYMAKLGTRRTRPAALVPGTHELHANVRRLASDLRWQ
jgi:epoxyqueuosine reductase